MSTPYSNDDSRPLCSEKISDALFLLFFRIYRDLVYFRSRRQLAGFYPREGSAVSAVGILRIAGPSIYPALPADCGAVGLAVLFDCDVAFERNHFDDRDGFERHANSDASDFCWGATDRGIHVGQL